MGKLYLFGGASLPLSLPTALHWLNRAALQEQDEAWMLIGSYVPFEHAQHCLPAVLSWYDRAYDAGVEQAGLVLAQLVLNQAASPAERHEASHLRDKALQALETAARAGSAEAQWLLAHQSGAQPPSAASPAPPPARRGLGSPPSHRGSARQQWLARAADSGLAAAQYAVLEQAWHGDRAAFLQRGAAAGAQAAGRRPPPMPKRPARPTGRWRQPS